MRKKPSLNGKLRIISSGKESNLEDFFQSGALKMLMPNTYGSTRELVLANTSGGIVGGDIYEIELSLKKASRLFLSSQAAERVYKSGGVASAFNVKIDLDEGSFLSWVPHETILFDDSSISRNFEINISKGSSAIFFDQLVFGRIAAGERLSKSNFSDKWLVTYDNKPVFLDCLSWKNELPDEGPLLGGSLAICSITYFGESDELYKKRSKEINAKIMGKLSAKDLSNVKFGSTARNNSVILRFACGDATLLRKITGDALDIFCDGELPRMRAQ